MNGPQRVQRRRVAGWRRPEGAKIVDRTSRWGNPFTVAESGSAEVAVQRYVEWLDGSPGYDDTYTVGRRAFDRRWVLANLHTLRGRDLCCPCAPGEPCHGNVLLRRANQDGGRA